MRIAHLCLSCFFIDNRGYQENELVREHVTDGHEVLVVASTETHAADGAISYTVAGDYMGDEGARVVRLPYRSGLPLRLASKLRMHSNVFGILEQFQPDSILFHGTCGWELITVARYIKRNRQVTLYVDSHEDWNNSARTVMSRELLHKVYYRSIIKRSLPAISKILCCSTEAMDFVHDVYGVSHEHLEFFPLGGKPIPDDEYHLRRSRARDQYRIRPHEIVIVQSGKQTKRKKLIDSLRAIAALDFEFRFLVVGVLHDDIREEAESLIRKTDRVSFLGWKSPLELTDILCAADVYLQPGTQSATMQHSLCSRCAVILDDVPAHAVYHRNNGWLVQGNDNLAAALSQLNTADLENMKLNSYRVAKELLDYTVLAKRVLE